MYGYIDESGQSGLSDKSSRYFILACILFEEESVAPRIAKSIFKKFRLGKDLKNQVHTTSESDRLRIKMLSEIKSNKYKLFYVKILKKEYNKDYYIEAFESLLKQISQEKIEKCFIAVKDARKNTLSKLNKIASENSVKIIFAKPEREKGLQIADFCAWSTYQKYEANKDEYYVLLHK